MFSEISSVLITVVAAAIASLLVWTIQSATQSGDLTGTVAQIAVVTILSLIISLRLHIAAMLRPCRAWRLARYVDSQWRYLDAESNLPVEINDRIRIRQIGSLVLGKAASTSTKNAPYQEFSYSICGVINSEGVIIGEWRNRNRGRNYYGSFMARVARNGKSLEAKWIGVGTTVIHYGDWDWRSDLGAQ